MRTNAKWNKGKIKRSGTYVFRDIETSEYEVVNIQCINGEWWLSDKDFTYSEPYEGNNKNIEWAKLS